MLKRQIFCAALAIGTVSGLYSCGRGDDHTDRRTRESDNVTPFNPADPYLVRGRWEFAVGVGANLTDPVKGLLGTGSSNTAMTATVAANVKFNVDKANFATPADPSGSASFGTLDITELRDNSLRECGAGNNQKCTKGVIRIYTTGTPGPGLWNTVEGYGLPISSSGNNVGLGTAGAFVAANATIGNKNVLKLTDFGASKVQIPVSADFSDAAAGSYATTIVVEYVVQ